MKEKATNFSESLLPKINKVLQFVLENPHSSFYRDKYKNQTPQEIKSYEDFQKIPPLTKDEILSVPIEKRIFVPEEDIEYYSFSSGTTNINRPTVIPHSSFYHETLQKYGFNEEKMREVRARRIMILLPPLSAAFLRQLLAPKKYAMAIQGNINDLKLSAIIAKEVRMQGLQTTATILDSFIDYLFVLITIFLPLSCFNI